MIKRFLLFCHDNYHPSGWEDDFKGSFDTLKEATKEAFDLKDKDNWIEIVDLETGKIDYWEDIR